MTYSIRNLIRAVLPCLATVAATTTTTTEAAASKKKPNFVFILTDDQDWHMESLNYMPLVRKYLLHEGTLFEKHYCTVAICCPSRVSLWTGQAAHNTNITDLHPPYGGYPRFIEQGYNDDWLPVWLQDLGYNTYYTGKLFNGHSIATYNNPPVKGFNGSDFLLDPYTYQYFNARMTRNGAVPVSYEGQYSPDVVAQKAYDFLDEAALRPEPFFLVAAPIAPHSNLRTWPDVEVSPPKYADRHAHLFQDYQIPRTANFNPDEASGVSWVSGLPKLNETVIEYNDEYQRSRLRSLQSVDEMVEGLVRQLEIKGLLDNTFIIHTTDNGFHISQHRMHPGKVCPFETDIHIPLTIRGPGVPANSTAGIISSHTDLTPTILKLAGGTVDRLKNLDGSPLPLLDLAASNPPPPSGEHVNVEFWGLAFPETKYVNLLPDPKDIPRNNTYKALRVIGNGYNLLYTVWCTGEREYYDLALDPDQMVNLLNPRQNSSSTCGRPEDYTLSSRPFFPHVLNRLDALLMVLKSCKGISCREPWSVLHPAETNGHLAQTGNREVKTLKDALYKDFDSFYERQPKVEFERCELGYLKEAEGPQEVHVFGSGLGEKGTDYARVVAEGEGRQERLGQGEYGGHWSWWT